MHTQHMAQNSFFLNETDHKVAKVQADTYLQNSHFGEGTDSIKNHSDLLNNFWELYSVILKPICKS